MRSFNLQHGPIHAVIYPKQGTGVMFVPDATLYGKDLSHDYNDMMASLDEWGLTPEPSVQRDSVIPVGRVECVQLVRAETRLQLVGS